MSKGSPIIPIRIPTDLLGRIHAEIDATNPRRNGEPFTVASWIRAAIEEKLAHAGRSRSRARKGRQTNGTADNGPGPAGALAEPAELPAPTEEGTGPELDARNGDGSA